MQTPSTFWEAPETVARFHHRAPDIHWRALLESRGWPAGTRSLDLGCAAGRNAPPALAAGLRPVLYDRSHAMLAAAGATGAPRVRGTMDALPFATASFGVVLALGVYHCARSDAELSAALAATARVLAPGGILLASLFSREMLPPDAPREPGQTMCYRSHGELLCRPDAEQLTAHLRTVGLEPEAPPESRPGPPESGRVTLLVTCRRAGT